MITLISATNVIAAIAIIALVAITLSVCVYLYGLKNKGTSPIEGNEEDK